MSYSKMDRLFPLHLTVMTESELAQSIAIALREDYGDFSSAVKVIGRQTGANLRAIKNWFEARHTPTSCHLLALARISPSTLKIVLGQMGGTDLYEAFILLSGTEKKTIQYPKLGLQNQSYSAENCTIAEARAPIIFEDMNRRQIWFLEQLRQNRRVRAADITAHWSVSTRTAKGDVAGVMRLQLIRFVGARKTGWYEAIHWPESDI